MIFPCVYPNNKFNELSSSAKVIMTVFLVFTSCSSVVSPSDEVIMIMSEDEEEEDIVDVKAAVTELDQFAEDIDSPDEVGVTLYC